MDYLGALTVPLGLAAQFLRGNGMSLRVVSGIMFVVCVGLIVLARIEGPKETTVMQTVVEGITWIMAAFGTMFTTAAGAYGYAAQGKNPEERAERAANPLVPVTDPAKTIHK